MDRDVIIDYPTGGTSPLSPHSKQLLSRALYKILGTTLGSITQEFLPKEPGTFIEGRFQLTLTPSTGVSIEKVKTAVSDLLKDHPGATIQS